MKKILLLLIPCILLVSCGASKYFINNSQEFKNFSSLLRQLDKKSNPALVSEIENRYQSITTNMLNDIEVYQTITEPDRWEKIISTYQTLNKLSEVVNKSKARSFLFPQSYLSALTVAKQNAAAEYYNLGLDKMQAGDKFSYRDAYYLFSKANEYYPGYQDVHRQMDIAWKESLLNVVINPVTDQSRYYASMAPNRFGNSFNSDLLQRNLVLDLGGSSAKTSSAKFYTDREAFMSRITPDWIVDITWTNLDIPYPAITKSTIERSKEIQISKDSSDKPIYQTVKATVYVSRQYFRALGELELRVTDALTQKNVDFQTYQSPIDFNQSYATFEGDRRALTKEDELMINNKTALPTREELLNELYDQIYPQLKNGIQYLVQY